jgi:hypothetical protein
VCAVVCVRVVQVLLLEGLGSLLAAAMLGRWVRGALLLTAALCCEGVSCVYGEGLGALRLQCWVGGRPMCGTRDRDASGDSDQLCLSQVVLGLALGVCLCLICERIVVVWELGAAAQACWKDNADDSSPGMVAWRCNSCVS